MKRFTDERSPNLPDASPLEIDVDFVIAATYILKQATTEMRCIVGAEPKHLNVAERRLTDVNLPDRSVGDKIACAALVP